MANVVCAYVCTIVAVILVWLVELERQFQMIRAAKSTVTPGIRPFCPVS